MRLEFESNTAALPFVENEINNQSAISEAANLLREGVKAAQEGRRAEAKETLLLATEIEPNNENAWLWLASISEYPEELLVFLNNVLKVNPTNERALDWKKATQSLLAKTLVQRGVDASKDNRNDFAKQCFEQALEQEAENEMAWLWLASVSDSNEEKASCFEKVLSLNPDNETAKASLRSINAQKAESLLVKAISTAVEGDHQAAQVMLADVLEQNKGLEEAWVLKAHLANSFEERAESLLRVRTLNSENEMANACLASWRSLVEKVESQAPAAEEKESTEQEIAIEQFNEVTQPETWMFDIPAQTSEEPEVLAEKYSFDEEYIAPDSPTQDLTSLTEYTEIIKEEIQERESLSSKTQETESTYEDFQNAEVSFESKEKVQTFAPETFSVEEIEAEESEMSWAFAGTPENTEFIDEHTFVNEEQSQPEATEHFENVSAEVEEPEVPAAINFESSKEIPMETVSEQPENEEWKNTSPNVFVGYTNEAENNLPEIQAAQESIAEETSEENAAQVNEVDESENLTAEVSAEGAAEMFSAPQESVEEEFSALKQEVIEPQLEQQEEEPVFSQSAKVELMLCPFCNTENEKQGFTCKSCQAILTMTNLDMLFAPNNADKEILQQSIASLEREHESYGLNAEQLAFLGIGQINLKNYRQGFMYLQEAVQKNPSNVVLDAQVNALAIRLSEMEKQQSIHDSQPKNCKILVVDDSPTVRKLIAGKLEKCGHEVICAVDGLDALDKINDLTPDLILLDITMPRMDGYQVCKEIRGNETTKDVPIVMISGKDGFFDKVRGRMAGTTGYITKPFGPETLMKTVETYLD